MKPTFGPRPASSSFVKYGKVKVTTHDVRMLEALPSAWVFSRIVFVLTSEVMTHALENDLLASWNSGMSY